MTKNKTVFVCNECGYESSKWLGKCPACNSWNTFFEQKVIEIIDGYKGEVAIASFNPMVLAYFKQHAPNILRGQLAGYLKNIKMKFVTRWALKRMILAKKVACADFIMYEAKTLPNRFVKRFKKLPLLAWTIKSQEEYIKVVKYCDNVIFEGFEPKI